MDRMIAQLSVADEALTPPVAQPIIPVDEPPVEVAPVPAPVVEPQVPVITPPVEVLVSREWQAKDEKGQPVGPPSKIFGRGATREAALENLADNLQKANEQAARKIKEYRDKYRTYDQEQSVLTFEPQVLTAEDRVRVARLLADPATIEQGYAELYRVQFGETPEEARKRKAHEAEIQRQQRSNMETDKFLLEHPDFPISGAARKVVVDAMQERRDQVAAEGKTFAWTAHNLEIIYDDLVEKGVLTPLQLASKPVSVIPESVVPSQIAPQPRTSQETTPPSATPAMPVVPAANTEGQTEGNTRPRGTKFSVMSTEHGQSPTTSRQTEDESFRKQVNDMPLEELKRRIRSDRKFADRLNALGPAKV
jgi:hypothetical protein